MKTVVILFGNSDDKLSQSEWAHFCAALKQRVEYFAHKMHFRGGSEYDAPWQNACMVFEIPEANLVRFSNELSGLRAAFEQESVAMIVGDTQLI